MFLEKNEITKTSSSVTFEDIRNCYMLFLGRSNHNTAEISSHLGMSKLQLLKALLNSSEFKYELVAQIYMTGFIGSGRFIDSMSPRFTKWACSFFKLTTETLEKNKHEKLWLNYLRLLLVDNHVKSIFKQIDCDTIVQIYIDNLYKLSSSEDFSLNNILSESLIIAPSKKITAIKLSNNEPNNLSYLSNKNVLDNISLIKPSNGLTSEKMNTTDKYRFPFFSRKKPKSSRLFFSVFNEDPYFIVSEVSLNGYFVLKIKLKYINLCNIGSPLKIYFDLGAGFNESDALTFPIKSSFLELNIVFFSDTDILSIRLDPCEFQCQLFLDGFTISKILDSEFSNIISWPSHRLVNNIKSNTGV